MSPQALNISVNNIGDHVNPKPLRAFFGKYGELEDGPVGYDKSTGKLRGFAIFVSKTQEGCKKALEEPTMQMLLGHPQPRYSGCRAVTIFEQEWRNSPPPYGVGLGLGGSGLGVNSFSPSVIGNYPSQVALQGLGTYQSNYWSSIGTNSQSRLPQCLGC